MHRPERNEASQTAITGSASNRFIFDNNHETESPRKRKGQALGESPPSPNERTA